jgi:hypothetical protein
LRVRFSLWFLVASMWPSQSQSLFALLSIYLSIYVSLPIYRPIHLHTYLSKKTPWPESASELYRPNDRRLSAKLMPTLENSGFHVVSVTNPYGRILGFLDRIQYIFFQAAPQLYSRGWVDPAPDPLHLRISGSAGNRIRTSKSVARNWPLDHRGGILYIQSPIFCNDVGHVW